MISSSIGSAVMISSSIGSAVMISSSTGSAVMISSSTGLSFFFPREDLRFPFGFFHTESSEFIRY